MDPESLNPSYQACELDDANDYSLNFGDEPQLPPTCAESCGPTFIQALRESHDNYEPSSNEPATCLTKVVLGNIGVSRTSGIGRKVTVTEHCPDHRQVAGRSIYSVRCQNPAEILRVIVDVS